MSNDAVAPRLAATLLCLRDNPETGMEVLMTVRHEALAFASGALVFPGGRVEPGDRDSAATRVPDRSLPDSVSPDEAALRVAAIRETFEEAGILLARHAATGRDIDEDEVQDLLARYRDPLAAGELSFGTMLQRENLVLTAGGLVRFAQWITPKIRPKRFDTHFFAARAPGGQVGGHDSVEAVESVWLSPARALAETEAGRYKLVFATRMNLMKLGRSARVEEALAAAARSPVVPVEPERFTEPDGRERIRIPAAADYGGEIFAAIDPPAM